MDLSRLKTVFIAILLIANIFMGYMIYNAEMHEREERLAMTADVSQILAKERIFLPNDFELPETPDANNYYLEKMFGSSDEMLLVFLGEGYVESGDRMFESDLGTLFVNGDEFVYRKKNIGASVGEYSNEEIESMCREEMKRRGIMEEAYSFGGINQIPDGKKAIFTVKHNDAEFFDAYMSFDVTKNGVTAIGGKNIISALEVAESSEVYPNVEGVLVGLIKSKNLAENVVHRIISVKHGYYIGRTEESYRNILAIPVWQIALESGQILHFDARNGRELEG